MAYIVVDDKNLTSTVQSNSNPVILYFWAEWCVPCKTVGPALEELAKEYDGKIILAKINADENPETVNKYAIMGLPTVMLFKEGEPVQSLSGAQNKQKYKSEIEKILV